MQAKREFILSILAPSLIFLSGFLTYILYHDYGVLTREVLLCIALITSVGLLIGCLLAAAGQSNLRAIGFALLLFIFFDIQFNSIEITHIFLDVNEGKLLRYVIVVLALFVFQLIVLGLRKYIASIITAIFTTTILTTLILPIQKVHFGPQSISSLEIPASDLPPVIHIILDGHIGIDGIPVDIEGGLELREMLVKFYEKWGFRLYGRAYSKYIATYSSLSNLLNGKTSLIDASVVEANYQAGHAGWKPKENIYFQQSAESGYRIRVYQTEYMDFCQDFNGSIEYCYRYSSSSPQLIRGFDIPLPEKVELIIGSYVSKSDALNALRIYYNTAQSFITGNSKITGIPKWERKNYAFSSLGVPSVIRHLKEDLLESPRGRLFFAHLLLPHGPYVWDSECKLGDNTDTWLARRMEHEDLLTRSNPGYRENAYRGYFQQTICTVSLLDDLLESLNSENSLEDATIIIHGDHGSRITIADPVSQMLDQLTDRDYIDSFSTLFAIRSVNIEPGYESEPRSIQGLFSELVLNDPVSEENAKVFLPTAGPVFSESLHPVTLPPF